MDKKAVYWTYHNKFKNFYAQYTEVLVYEYP